MNTAKVVKLITQVVTAHQTIYDNLYNAYTALLNHHIVTKEEITTLEAWIKDLQNLAK